MHVSCQFSVFLSVTCDRIKKTKPLVMWPLAKTEAAHEGRGDASQVSERSSPSVSQPVRGWEGPAVSACFCSEVLDSGAALRSSWGLLLCIFLLTGQHLFHKVTGRAGAYQTAIQPRYPW